MRKILATVEIMKKKNLENKTENQVGLILKSHLCYEGTSDGDTRSREEVDNDARFYCERPSFVNFNHFTDEIRAVSSSHELSILHHLSEDIGSSTWNKQ